MAAALVGCEEASYAAALDAIGGGLGRWEAANDRWAEKVSESPKLHKRFTAAMREALAAQLGGERELDLGRYVAVNVAVRAGDSYDESCASVGMSPREFYLASMKWQERMSGDRRLAAVFEVRTRVGVLRRGQAEPVLEEPRPAPIVFATQCGHCGGRKQTKPRTAYVYCDYCGHLFDYDWERARETIDDAQVSVVLFDAIRDDLAESREAGDWDAYRAHWAWYYDVDIEVTPEGWSPRVGDPAYRKAIIDYSVETCVLRNADDEMKRATAAYRKALRQFDGDESVDAMCKRFGIYARGLDADVDIYERRGVLQRHPDELTAETWRQVNLSIQLSQVANSLQGEALERVIDASGLRREVVNAAPPLLTRSVCGSCGGQLLVVSGAHHLVCESCGVTLNSTATHFTCPGCGAPVVRAVGKELACGYCRSQFRC